MIHVLCTPSASLRQSSAHTWKLRYSRIPLYLMSAPFYTKHVMFLKCMCLSWSPRECESDKARNQCPSRWRGATVSLASSWTLSFWVHPLSGGGAVLISSESFLFMLDFETPSQTFAVQWWKDLRANQKHRLSHRLLNGSLNFHLIPWGNCLHVAMWLYHGLVRYKSA